MAETASRVLSLLNLLQTHRQWPGTELAQRLGVTDRTLRRDIDRLRELGYRVQATRGAAGGYRLEAGSQLPPLLLTDEEAVTMAIGLRLASTRGLVDGEHTTLSALAKFEQVLPSALRQRVNALAASVRTGTPRANPVASDLLGKLALACRDAERIRFHYTAASGEETQRVVEPHTLVPTERSWFLVCWDLRREDWRTFRVDRIGGFQPTGVRFSPRELPAADAAEFVKSNILALRWRSTAHVELDMPIAEVREHFGDWAREATPINDTTTRWPISGETPGEVLSALVWIPEGVSYRVVGPPEVVAAARDVARRVADALG